jgi:hypothetical protein
MDYNIQMDFNVVDYEGVDRIVLTQEMIQWWDLVNSGIYLWDSLKTQELLPAQRRSVSQ